MFALLAPRLRDNGWRSVIPIAQPGKRPLTTGWEAYNRAAPTDDEIHSWCTRYPDAGIGLAYGPDEVLGVDLDFVDPAMAELAHATVNETLGPTDCIRIGRRPKCLLLYRAAPRLIVPGKSFGGYELFSSTCQTVLYGVHPDTGQRYYWPSCSPEDISPADLPIAKQETVDILIKMLEPYTSRLRSKHCHPTVLSSSGRVTEWLQVFNSTPGSPASLCRQAVELAPEGDRYPTAFSAIVALVRIGLSDAEIITNIVVPYLARFDQQFQPDRQQAIISGLRWARTTIGPDKDAISTILGTKQIFARWRARWKSQP
jgi:hypothetical protein